MKRLAVIGCGLRSNAYLHGIKADQGRAWELAALADPNQAARDLYIRNHGGNDEVRVFDDGPELLRAMRGKIDAVIIGSP